MPEPVSRGIRSAQAGMATNAALALTKLVAGVLGNSYALIADAIESTADILSSLIVWGGLRIAARAPDDEYPFGYGKAESLAATVVSLMLLGAALVIAVQATNEIRTPHHTPAAFTLAVLVGVIAVKEFLFRKVFTVGDELGSTAVKADAWHHRSDAITSAAAFLGISIALVGGHGWESADDWAAIAAAGIIFFNGTRILRPAVADLMDRAPDPGLLRQVATAAHSTAGVQAIEKLKMRKAGLGYFVELHVQTDPELSLYDAHIVGGRVKSAIREAVPSILGVLVHMEPYLEACAVGGGRERETRQS